MDTTCVEYVTALQFLHLCAGTKNLEANGTTDFLLLTLDFFAFSLSETILCASVLSLFTLLLHAHRAVMAVGGGFLELVTRDGINDIFDLFRRWQRFPIGI